MWSLVANELLVTLTNLGANCQRHADDIVIIARGKLKERFATWDRERLMLQKNIAALWDLSNPGKRALIIHHEKTDSHYNTIPNGGD